MWNGVLPGWAQSIHHHFGKGSRFMDQAVKFFLYTRVSEGGMDPSKYPPSCVCVCVCVCVCLVGISSYGFQKVELSPLRCVCVFDWYLLMWVSECGIESSHGGLKVSTFILVRGHDSWTKLWSFLKFCADKQTNKNGPRCNTLSFANGNKSTAGSARTFKGGE